jgi:anti-sigma factor RsiW
MKEGNILACGREGELIAFLYGELNDGEARTFRQHMRGCSACSSELAAFNNVRESVVAWRNESLGSVSSPALVTHPAVSASRRKPSALAALREFFNLSPLWMKGAIAFTSVFFCLFTVLAIARWRETSHAPLTSTQKNQLYTEQQLNSLVERRLQEEIERIKRDQQQAANPALTARDNSQKGVDKNVLSRSNEDAKAASGAGARRPLSRVEREQLAADLRLISSKSDSELDLLDDRINQ